MKFTSSRPDCQEEFWIDVSGLRISGMYGSWYVYKKLKSNLVVLLSWCFIIKLAELKINAYMNWLPEGYKKVKEKKT